jgi:hypothetical protein
MPSDLLQQKGPVVVGFMTHSRMDPRADAALRLATAWGPGQTVDGVNALGHAFNVANALGQYIPDTPPQVVAASLLHAIPCWPMADEAVLEFVEAQCGVEARLLLEALRAEHAVLATPSADAVDRHLRLLRTMPWLAHATLTAKIVTLQYATAHADARRGAEAVRKPGMSIEEQSPYLRQLLAVAREVVPPIMTADYVRLLDQCLPMPTAAASR